jgi:hypothetical protein
MLGNPVFDKNRVSGCLVFHPPTASQLDLELDTAVPPTVGVGAAGKTSRLQNTIIPAVLSPQTPLSPDLANLQDYAHSSTLTSVSKRLSRVILAFSIS